MNVPRLGSFVAAAVLASALSWGGAAQAASRVAVLPALGPGSGNGLVYVDALQQSTGWRSVDGSSLALDPAGNLLGLWPGQAAERIVYTTERYPTGDYLLEWSGSATFEIRGGTLLPGRGPNSLTVRVAGNDGSGLALRVTGTDPGQPVRDLHLYLPGYDRSTAAQRFTPEFVKSVLGADVVRFAGWERVDSFIGSSWAQRPTLERPTQAEASGAALEDQVELANLTGANPAISVPADANDDYVRNMAKFVRRTLDPSLHPVVNYSDTEMRVPGTRLNQFAVAQARSAGIVSTSPQHAALEWYQTRSAQVLAIFRQELGSRVVAADSAAAANLQRTVR